MSATASEFTDDPGTDRLDFDHLVLGSGIAGLTFALRAAARGPTAVVTKRALTESNTYYAQGGIAGVLSSEDSLADHVHDTLRPARAVPARGRQMFRARELRIGELIELGMTSPATRRRAATTSPAREATATGASSTPPT